MFRNAILKKCKDWFKSNKCTVNELVTYIEMTGRMRDAQIEAIKIYLFLKIACNNEPLYLLVSKGTFNTICLEDIELKPNTYKFLQKNPAAVALFQYCLEMKKFDKKVDKIEQIIRNDPQSLDYSKIIRNIFYNITYTDYIFSLPMGAGKTYLMAAFMYLDLYFSSIDTTNEAFAQNFIILAPSGLKSSIVPSLRTISNFDPAWIFNKEIAENLKRDLVFETLEANASDAKSNKARNPNARKVNMLLANGEPRGVVLVTNAEKVILDRMSTNTLNPFLELSDDERDRSSNELRNIIGKIPRLSIMIDEVHHATDDSIKLRSVVSRWAEKKSVVSVIGFSGTPYLGKVDNISIDEKCSLNISEISNVAYFYPLVNGIGNFLKKPIVRTFENRENHLEIVELGLRSFFENTIDKKYSNGTIPKIAIYCTSINALEEDVYPLSCRISEEYGFKSTDVVLKYHDGNAIYKPAADSSMEFATLDRPVSKIRVILLVKIGTEGWDCKSLDGVILSNENKSTKNKILQTCCRCLRQVSRYDEETAYIYLCKSNELVLSAQLKEEQHISIKEFQEGKKKQLRELQFYNRKEVIDLPPVYYYQFIVEDSIVVDSDINISANLRSVPIEEYKVERKIVDKTFKNETISVEYENFEFGIERVDVATLNSWIMEISKESFGFITVTQLNDYNKELHSIFDGITIDCEGVRYFSSKFDRKQINSKIRQCFYAHRHFDTKAEYTLSKSDLLLVCNFDNRKIVPEPDKYYPDQGEVEKTKNDDEIGFTNREYMRHRFHYMPYHLDSGLEMDTLSLLHTLDIIKRNDIDVYYNGDRFLSDFHILCYESIGSRWKYIGRYTPDFLIVKRNKEEICKAIVVETKGEIYANDKKFLEKKSFVEKHFINDNNSKFNYEKFSYLYVEGSMPAEERATLLIDTIKTFFEVS
jgi:hypothetical protein